MHRGVDPSSELEADSPDKLSMHESRCNAAGIMNCEVRIEALQTMLSGAMYLMKAERDKRGDGAKFVYKLSQDLNTMGDRTYQDYFHKRGHTKRDEDGNIHVDGPYRVYGDRPDGLGDAQGHLRRL